MSKERGVFTVIGRDPDDPKWWMVRRPDGLECGGRWVSEEDAQKSCDSWNKRSPLDWATRSIEETNNHKD